MHAMKRLPGAIASVFMIVAVTAVTWWSANEMFHEGWWGAWWHPLRYLAPTVAVLVPTLLAFRWPLVGGVVIVAVGAFSHWFFGNDVAVFGLGIATVGVAFVLDGVLARRAAATGASVGSR